MPAHPTEPFLPSAAPSPVVANRLSLPSSSLLIFFPPKFDTSYIMLNQDKDKPRRKTSKTSVQRSDPSPAATRSDFDFLASEDGALTPSVVSSPALRSSPYHSGLHSATASTSTFKSAGSPLVRPPAAPRNPSTSRRSPANDAVSAFNDTTSVRRLTTSNPSTTSLAAITKESSGRSTKTVTQSDPPTPRIRIVPHLAHSNSVEPAPASVMYWSRAPVWGTLPSHSMRAHTVTLVDNIAWLFGGCDDKGCWKDVWCFNTGISRYISHRNHVTM